MVVMPITVRKPSRESLLRICAELTSQRDDLDPTGYAYEAKTLQLDAALAALWALGPKPR